ncbi:MAG TPA: LysR family transcriptional regulator [Polyangiaceae bacterium]|nr:LysR family transcriptional regulator [Polyangiaceae bacterium]
MIVFSVLAEERSVSRSASRLWLSQPAVSRALQRLREMFQDERIVRSQGCTCVLPKSARLQERFLRFALPRGL